MTRTTYLQFGVNEIETCWQLAESTLVRLCRTRSSHEGLLRILTCLYSSHYSSLAYLDLQEEPFHATTGVRVLTSASVAQTRRYCRGCMSGWVDPSLAEFLANSVNSIKLQRPESAAVGCVTMFKAGANGSVWLAQNDAPAEDITPTMEQAYATMASVLK